jgi:hypothetical protein
MPRSLHFTLGRNAATTLRLVIGTLGFLCGTESRAEWLLVEPDANQAPDPFVVFIDSESITNKRDRMNVRVLLNMRRRTEDGVGSVIAEDEYDCRTERMRTLSMVSYADTDGRGAVVREFKTIGEWVKVEAGKINEAVMDSACP